MQRYLMPVSIRCYLYWVDVKQKRVLHRGHYNDIPVEDIVVEDRNLEDRNLDYRKMVNILNKELVRHEDSNQKLYLMHMARLDLVMDMNRIVPVLDKLVLSTLD
jgi:hypothetical protein